MKAHPFLKSCSLRSRHLFHIGIFFLFLIGSAFTLHDDPPSFKFSDKEFEVGSIMIRRNIAFADDYKTKLKPSKTLDSVVTLLKNYPNLKMEIGTHMGKPCKTCINSSPSENSANAIKKYLVGKGIDEKRLLAKGYGLTTPLVADENGQPLQTAKAQKVNERVEFKITYNKF